ncbi:MAG: hypothetical protein HY694_08695 [Deltaproteobacteria bacterium]|nr:hypothetical protein [Deltaproteobacteria bacterium]
MDLNGLRIGYVPYSGALNRPGDRRRFCYYARKKNIPFEIAKPSETYDVVMVTAAADISVWSKYQKGKAKIVYDLIDSYLAIPQWDIKGLLRGFAKYVIGQSSYLQLSYWKAVQEMCQRADAVVCTTDEQKQDILRFCQNVHIILDIHNTVIHTVKRGYSAGDTFNFVWEGLPGNLRTFYEIRDVLERLKVKHKIALHIVTDLEYRQYMEQYGKRNTIDLARKVFHPVYLYEWNEQLCSTIISACDMALIPIRLRDPIYVGKPENKLILFWRLGLPAVVSATPAHERAMLQCGLDMACRTQQDWQETLERYIVDQSARQEAGERGKAFADTHYSEERILARWDRLFTSVLSP